MGKAILFFWRALPCRCTRLYTSSRICCHHLIRKNRSRDILAWKLPI